MDLRDLNYFETIAGLQHMGAAAEQLHRTQPALTASVRRLEAFCGAPLFERAGRGIRLTAEGRILLAWARRLRLDVQDARREMAALSAGTAGHVRIGVVPTAAQFLLPVAMQRLLREMPQVTVKTTVGLREDLRPRLRAGELDLVVVSGHDPDPEFSYAPLGEDRIVVVAARGHPLLGRAKKPTLAELGGYDWILQPPGSPTRDWIDHAFDRLKVPRPRVRIESDMLLMLPALMAGTQILGFVSRLHLDATDSSKILHEVPMARLSMRRQFVASWRKAAYLPAAARLMVKYLEEAQAPV